MGARCKSQALEGNVDELQIIPAGCHHTHNPNEWKPFRDSSGGWVYPSSEEAEYTADLAFALAVALSWWATRTGRAKLHVPRAPSPQEAGNRCGWEQLDPQTLRSLVFPSTAMRLGLAPPETSPGAWFPESWTKPFACWRLSTAAFHAAKVI